MTIFNFSLFKNVHVTQTPQVIELQKAIRTAKLTLNSLDYDKSEHQRIIDQYPENESQYHMDQLEEIEVLKGWERTHLQQCEAKLRKILEASDLHQSSIEAACAG
jgi:hypothetical protein